jgi:hypothetical protein
MVEQDTSNKSQYSRWGWDYHCGQTLSRNLRWIPNYARVIFISWSLDEDRNSADGGHSFPDTESWTEGESWKSEETKLRQHSAHAFSWNGNCSGASGSIQSHSRFAASLIFGEAVRFSCRDISVCKRIRFLSFSLLPCSTRLCKAWIHRVSSELFSDRMTRVRISYLLSFSMPETDSFQ